MPLDTSHNLIVPSWFRRGPASCHPGWKPSSWGLSECPLPLPTWRWRCFYRCPRPRGFVARSPTVAKVFPSGLKTGDKAKSPASLMVKQAFLPAAPRRCPGKTIRSGCVPSWHVPTASPSCPPTSRGEGLAIRAEGHGIGTASVCPREGGGCPRRWPHYVPHAHLSCYKLPAAGALPSGLKATDETSLEVSSLGRWPSSSIRRMSHNFTVLSVLPGTPGSCHREEKVTEWTNIGVPLESGFVLAACHVPQPGTVVVARRGQSFPIWAESHTTDECRYAPGESARSLKGRHVPQPSPSRRKPRRARVLPSGEKANRHDRVPNGPGMLPCSCPWPRPTVLLSDPGSPRPGSCRPG